jgi:hypothetical protein
VCDDYDRFVIFLFVVVLRIRRFVVSALAETLPNFLTDRWETVLVADSSDIHAFGDLVALHGPFVGTIGRGPPRRLRYFILVS